MSIDGPLRPIRRVQPVRREGDVELPRHPPLRQLKQWLAFVQRKNRDKKRKPPEDGHAE